LLRLPFGGPKVSFGIGTFPNYPARDNQGTGIIVLYSKTWWDNIARKPNLYYYKATQTYWKIIPRGEAASGGIKKQIARILRGEGGFDLHLVTYRCFLLLWPPLVIPKELLSRR